jgi:hypothetical protein
MAWSAGSWSCRHRHRHRRRQLVAEPAPCRRVEQVDPVWRGCEAEVVAPAHLQAGVETGDDSAGLDTADSWPGCQPAVGKQVAPEVLDRADLEVYERTGELALSLEHEVLGPDADSHLAAGTGG